MEKRICPYCDQAMTGVMYCRGCKRLVLKPVIWDVDYYLNERHPESETQCQYHGDLHTGEMKGRGAMAGAGTAKKGQLRGGTGTQTRERKSAWGGTGTQTGAAESVWSGLESWAKAQSQAAARPKAGAKKQSGGKKSAAGSFRSLGLVLIIYAVLMLVSVGFKVYKSFQESSEELVKLFTSVAEPQPEPVWDEAAGAAAAAEPEEDISIWERSDQEVRAAGIPCNGYGHFEVGEEEARAVFEGLLNDSSIEWGVDLSSSNQFMDGYTWYNTTYEYYLYREGVYWGFADLSFDTVDGRMHGLSLVMNEAEAMNETADIALSLLEQLDLLDEPQDGRRVFEKALESRERGEEFRLQDDLEINAAVLDDGLHLMYIDAEQ